MTLHTLRGRKFKFNEMFVSGDTWVTFPTPYSNPLPDPIGCIICPWEEVLIELCGGAPAAALKKEYCYETPLVSSARICGHAGKQK